MHFRNLPLRESSFLRVLDDQTIVRFDTDTRIHTVIPESEDFLANLWNSWAEPNDGKHNWFVVSENPLQPTQCNIVFS